MKSTEDPGHDIKLIRQMMEESSKFLSLSGLSGIAAGFTAMVGAAIAWFVILDSGSIKYDEYFNLLTGQRHNDIRLALMLDGLFVLVIAIALAWYFSWRNCKRKNQPFFTASSRKLIMSLLSILSIGGLFSIILFFHGYFKLIAPVMLIFYGLSLINSSKYSHRDIKQLGYLEVFTGLLASIFLDYSILFWTLGFGVFHILYGIIMYVKYDAKEKEK